MPYSVAQNTSFLTVASVLQKVITFFYFALIARLIGVENTSQYFLAITFSMIFIVFADLGLSSVLTREAAKFPEKAETYLNSIISIKFFLGLIVYLFMIATAYLFNYGKSTIELMCLSGVTMFFDNLHSAYYSVFRANKNLIYESIALVCSQAVTLIIGAVALFQKWPLIALIAAYTIPSFFNVIYAAYFARKVFQIKYYFIWNKEVIKMFIGLAWPFALAGIIGRLYAFSDSLLMSKMLNNLALGWWSVSYKISAVFQFIPIALSASAYPVFSKLYLSDKNQTGLLFEKSYRYIFFIALPITFGILVLSKPFIVALYGEQFAPSVVPLQILILSLVFSFLTFVNGALLNAINKQKAQTCLMGAVLLTSVILNVILLPKWQIVGAAATSLLTNFILFAAGYLLVKEYIPLSSGKIFKYLNQNLWPAIIMGAAVYFLAQKIHFLFTIPIGGMIYFCLLFATKALDKEIIIRVWSKVSGKNYSI